MSYINLNMQETYNDSDNDNNNNNYNNYDNYEKRTDYDMIDESLIPSNPSIDNYNQTFYELYTKIKQERHKIDVLIKLLDDYIIIPTRVNFDETLEVSIRCLRALSYASTKKWGTNQNLARLIMADIFFPEAFYWQSVYDDTWNDELQNIGF